MNGWRVGDGASHGDDADLALVYELLEGDVRAAWADPARWAQMMAASVHMATTKFSSDRMVREYFERLYRLAVEHA